MKYFAVFLLMLLVACTHAGDKKCRALVLSGAGSQGAYQAAVLQALTNYCPDPETEFAWDVVAGVSAGSLNALGLGGYSADQVNAGTDFVYALWNSIPDYRAFGNWKFGILQGIFKEAGMFDLSPGKEWVKEQWGSNTVNRKISFATVDATTADYTVWDYNATGTLPDDYIASAFASSSIPGFFPPTIRGDKTLIDGGVIWNIDIPSAVRRCREVVDDEKDIIIDMVVVGDHDIETVDNLHRFNVYDHFMRAREISSFYNYMNDYRTCMHMYPDVTFRHFIHPSESLPGGMLPLDFSRSAVDGCFAVGQKDAQNACKMGATVHRDLLLEFYDKRRDGEKVRFKDMVEAKLAELEKVQTASE